jgi:cysteine desulfurase NifS/selenium donor protein
MQNPVYLDYNATTPIDPVVKDVMQPFLDQYFGNPSSAHLYGAQTKKAIEQARRQIAELINCFADEIVFTSGGTEANNYAIKGIAYQNRQKGNHIITSQIEHPAVTEVCLFLETQGFSVTWIPVDEWGVVDIYALEQAIMPGTILISIMHANNETGTIQPVEQIGALAKKHGIVFHCDAAQSAGKIPIEVKEMGVDLLSLAGHKFYAPKGVGALYVKRGLQLQKLMHGANHEQNLRAGTENVLEIAGLGKAAEIALRDFAQNTQQMKSTRDLLFGLLQEALPQIKLNGHPDLRLPNTLNISFPGLEANVLLDELSGIAASAGAACHTDSVDISPVLMAMKVPLDFAKGTIRFSTGKKTTEQEIKSAAQMIIEAVNRFMPDSNIETVDDIPETGEIKLTRYTQGLGCACKIRPQYLEKVLQDLPPVFDPNVLVGTATSDDAAVYRLSDTMALVQTLDFFTPIVDDPYSFGAIAAANALSDIYAMGARPLFALNIVGFPSNRLPMQVLKDILRGASDKASEAGISILGGHSVDDPEPKFGMVVSGLVDPNKLLTNGGAKPGDVLILTKPIGTGIISTSVKRNLASDEIARAALDVMIALNANAANVMMGYPVHACTDVTGFGLLGHLNEMIAASDASCRINVTDVPLIEGVYDLAMAGAIPGGSRNNLLFVNDHIAWSEGISEVQKLILADAQTSGGLLISMDAALADKYIADLASRHKQLAWKIGEIFPKGTKRIEISG